MNMKIICRHQGQIFSGAIYASADILFLCTSAFPAIAIICPAVIQDGKEKVQVLIDTLVSGQGTSAPRLITPLPDQFTYVNERFSYVIPESTFSARGLRWEANSTCSDFFQFDRAKREIRGVAPSGLGLQGDCVFTIRVVDPVSFASAQTSLTLRV
eukprot:g75618.t1